MSLFKITLTTYLTLLTSTSALKLEPFVPPIAVQTAQQASLPNVIHINYDVPNAGISKELEALRNASFLELGESEKVSDFSPHKTDVYFEPPVLAEVLEQDYQKTLGKVCSSIKNKMHHDMDGNASFLNAESNARWGSDCVHLFVDEHSKGKDIDLQRLRSDAYACAGSAIFTSFLGVRAHGDEIPGRKPVLNIDIPVRNYVSGGELSALTV